MIIAVNIGYLQTLKPKVKIRVDLHIENHAAGLTQLHYIISAFPQNLVQMNS